jgi:predicted transcriptional regulator
MERRAKYRSRMDISASVLETAAKEGKMRITKMAYDSRLSNHQIRSHIWLLVEGHLLNHYDKSYSITEKGKKFLRLYTNLVDMVRINR